MPNQKVGNKKWFGPSSRKMIRLKNEARMGIMLTEKDQHTYQQCGRKAKQVLRCANRKHMEEEIISIEQKYKNEIRNFYQEDKIPENNPL